MAQLPPKLFSSGIEHASFVTSYQILKKAWNVISSNYQDIVTNDGVGLCWKVYKEQNPDLTIIAFEATKDSSNLQSDLISSSDLNKKKNFHQFDFLCSKKNPSFSLNSTAFSLFYDNIQKLDELKSKDYLNHSHKIRWTPEPQIGSPVRPVRQNSSTIRMNQGTQRTIV
ncbi:hypothetical protein MTR_0286s0050 [Medicago truncatula]|uniref:Uncharacterized protein n=1 Tax=Medicago truncatula TaxID=3880 RepID=A0A072TGR7_MEDTR|nr:hypothetical protein MTR_0286s0050 [Medicago truncatula]